MFGYRLQAIVYKIWRLSLRASILVNAPSLSSVFNHVILSLQIYGTGVRKKSEFESFVEFVWFLHFNPFDLDAPGVGGIVQGGLHDVADGLTLR